MIQFQTYVTQLKISIFKIENHLNLLHKIVFNINIRCCTLMIHLIMPRILILIKLITPLITCLSDHLRREITPKQRPYFYFPSVTLQLFFLYHEERPLTLKDQWCHFPWAISRDKFVVRLELSLWYIIIAFSFRTVM